MKKKQIITLVACSIGGLLLLGAAYLLFRSMMQFRRVDAQFAQLQNRLGQFYRAEAFPSLENVGRERENQEEVEAWFAQLMAELGKGNVSSEERSPSRFVGVLERARERLLQQAASGRVRFPEGTRATFAFGFDRYVGTGRLPAPDDVPRLTEQLMLVTRLAWVLFESEITSLRSIERDVFEDGPAASVMEPTPTPTTRRSAARRADTAAAAPPVRVPGIIAQDEDFGVYRFVLEFSARESALASVLNAFSSGPTFVVVRSLTLRKEVPNLLVVRTAPQPGAPAQPATARPVADVSFLFGGLEDPAQERAAAPRQESTVLGPSHPVSGIEMEIPMQVRLELDVYKFRGLDEAGN